MITSATAARSRPERAAVFVAGAAWLATAAMHSSPDPFGHGAHHHPAGLPAWALMCVAMMVPTVLPAVRHVAVNSLRRRRLRATGEFVTVYTAVWVAFGAVVLPSLAPLDGVATTPALAAALLVAAAWQVLPYQRRCLVACHRTVPLPPRGRLAVAGCARFGWRHGLACLGVCWPFMLVMAVLWTAGAGGFAMIVWMAVLTAMSAAVKLVPPSRGLASPLALGLATFAVVLLVL